MFVDVGLFLLAAAIIAAVLVDLVAVVVAVVVVGAFEFDVVEDEDESSWVNGIDDFTLDDLFSLEVFDVLDRESVALRLSLLLAAVEDVSSLPLLGVNDDDEVPAVLLALVAAEVPDDFCFFFY